MRRSPRLLVLPVVLALGLGAAACGGDDDGDDPVGTTTTSTSTVTTTAGPGTTATTPTTTPGTTDPPPTTEVPPSTGGPTTTSVAMQPGQPCTLGSDPDCIDPSGIGEGVYLIGGADCMAGGYPDICVDLDGDGRAGYPDRS